MAESIPEDVRRFIVENINSVEQLEVLLLLKHHPGREWDAEAVSQALYSTPPAVLMRLTDLRDRGFLAEFPGPAPRFRYAPSRPGLDKLVEQLVQVYRNMRVSVITLIYSQPNSHVQAFADAFRLRKDK